MNKIQDIDEVEIFVQNLYNIIIELKLSKSKLNKKLKWPTNKLSNILTHKQEPLIKDAKSIRTMLGIPLCDLLTRALTKSEIDSFSYKLSDVVLSKKRPIDSIPGNAVSHIIVLLSKKYRVKTEFTKKDIIRSIPEKFANYSIEWEKSRLKKYVKKVGEITNAENKDEHIFKLVKELPIEMVQRAIEEVGTDWLEA